MIDTKEWAIINDIILLIHGKKNLTDMRKAFLEAVKKLILYDKAMFYMIHDDGVMPVLDDPVFVNVDDEFARAYENTVANDQYGRVAMNSRKSFIFRDSDFMPERVRVNTDIYLSFLKPYDVPFGSSIIIADDDRLIAEVTFFRQGKRNDFTDKDIDILKILMSHLELRLLNDTKADTRTSEERERKLAGLGLTRRETEIVRHVVENLSTAEISNLLNISPATTKRHLYNIFEKLGINSRLQLVGIYNKL